VPEKSTPKVNWEPISALPLIGSMIDGLLDEVEKQNANLQAGRAKPYVAAPLPRSLADSCRSIFRTLRVHIPSPDNWVKPGLWAPCGSLSHVYTILYRHGCSSEWDETKAARINLPGPSASIWQPPHFTISIPCTGARAWCGANAVIG